MCQSPVLTDGKAIFSVQRRRINIADQNDRMDSSSHCRLRWKSWLTHTFKYKFIFLSVTRMHKKRSVCHYLMAFFGFAFKHEVQSDETFSSCVLSKKCEETIELFIER